MNNSKIVRRFHIIIATLVLATLTCVVSRASAQSQEEMRATSDRIMDFLESGFDVLGSSSSAKAKTKKTQKTKTDNKPTYSLKPFDIESKRISSNFIGHDVAELLGALNKLTNIKKGEFESASDYNQRLLEIKNKANRTIGYGSLKMGDYVAFPMKSKRSTDSITSSYYPHYIDLSYDADFQTLKVSFNRDAFLFSNKSFFLVLGLYKKKPIGITLQKNLDTGRTINELVVKNVSSSYAATNLSHLTLCCVGQLYSYDVEQTQYQDFRKENGTIPFSSFDLLPLSDVQFWLYNVKTGEVLAKFSSHDLEIGMNRTLGDTTLRDPTKAKAFEETWKQIQTGRKQLKPQSWEGKQPSLVVSSSTANLAKELQNAPKGSVVQIKKGTRINLDAPAILANAISIVGETDDPQDSVIVVTRDKYLAIQSSEVYFKGITFEIDPNENNVPPQSIIKVDSSGDAQFIDCAFKGNRSVETVGVSIDEGNARFWNCSVEEFGDAGIVAQKNGSAKVAYCKFYDNKVGVKAGMKGTIGAAACFFSHNGIGYDAQEEGEGSLNYSLFDANESPWSVSNKSNSLVKLDQKTNVVNR